MYVVADFFISLQENFLFIWSNIKVTIIQEPSLWMNLSGFRNLLIVCTRITPVVLDVPDAVEAGQELMHRERSRLDKRLLALEEEYNGRAFYAGSCILCPWEECTRRSGKACRYPLRIRRSLEACGFDLGRTTSELFGIEMKWSENRNLPEYLLLVSGFLYDWETPIW